MKTKTSQFRLSSRSNNFKFEINRGSGHFFSYIKNFFLVKREINYFKPDIIHIIGSNYPRNPQVDLVNPSQRDKQALVDRN